MRRTLWHGYLRVGTEEKARRVLDRVEACWGARLELDTVEPYWKDPALYRVVFHTDLEARSLADAVVEILDHATRLARRCSVTAPRGGGGVRWEFAGDLEHPSFPGVEMLSFEIEDTEAGPEA